MSAPSIHWFRLDLRLADNPALRAAIERGGPVVPVFTWATEEEGDWPPGGASKWWLHQSLAKLDAQLRAAGSRLVIRRGPTLESLRALAKETGAAAVFWNRRHEPAVIARDAKVKEALGSDGFAAESFNAALLHEPWTIQNQSNKPFQVFTPFWRHCLAKPDPAEPLPAPKNILSPSKWPKSLALGELELESKLNWSDGLRAAWHPGEVGATANLSRFLAKAFDDYTDHRNRPDVTGTSRLSPHLHFGEISPCQVWHGLRRLASKRGLPVEQWRGSQFLAELGWREFAHHLLFHFPHTPAEPLRADFKKFPWRKDAAWLRAWQVGRTGYPIVDAGMRELWATGWMHNRVRMIAASFLVKDLLLPWQEGARWFWDTLVDADLANNTLGWQWTAGCGADAAPYFRVFNPTSQGEKFDPQGDYVRKWCPELAKLPAEWIHQPDKAPTEILRVAGVKPGHNYPQPIVNHAIAREVALAAFARLKGGAK
ncbi:MAG: DNA photolyase family protein [Verrucomicrobia bacterium]|jgi:deoxyribodipyrimidine photo-lyase|nr:DNA photolyase family protein [Verrucomicrobiota bacterium]